MAKLLSRTISLFAKLFSGNSSQGEESGYCQVVRKSLAGGLGGLYGPMLESRSLPVPVNSDRARAPTMP